MTEKSIDWQAAIDNYIAAQDNRRPEKMPPTVFRASSVNGCLRQTVRNHLGLSSFKTETLRHFMVGTVAHRFLQEKVAVGFVDRPVQFEVPVRLDLPSEDVTITGHIDCYDGETVYDFKTTSNLKLSSSNVMKGYLWQASIYCYAKGAERAEVVYIDKRSYEVCQKDITEQLIPVEEIRAFMRSVLEAEALYKQGRTNPDGTTTLGVLPEYDDCFNCKQEQKEAKEAPQPKSNGDCSGCGLPNCLHDGTGFCPPGTEDFGGRR